MTTVVLGTQEWDVENLNVDTLGDGTPIPLVTVQADWAALTTPGRCYYNNSTDPVYQAKYGQLYNWYALDGIVPAALAAEGWRVPSEADLLTLETWLIANGYNWDGTTTGNKIGKSVASKSGEWSSSSTAGHIGNAQTTNNSSGLTILPAGSRLDTGVFGNSGTAGYVWSATSSTSTTARYITGASAAAVFAYSAAINKKRGFTVRLVRDYVDPSSDSTVQLSSVDTSESFGSPVIKSSIVVSVNSISTDETFGSIVLTSSNTVTMSGISSAEVFGQASIFNANMFAVLSSISSSELFGQPTFILAGNTPTICTLSGIVTAEIFGSVTANASVTIYPSSISSAEYVGSIIAVPGIYRVVLDSIVSSTSFGVLTFINTGNMLLRLAGIYSSELFGAFKISNDDITIPMSSSDKSSKCMRCIKDVDIIDLSLTESNSAQGLRKSKTSGELSDEFRKRLIGFYQRTLPGD